MDIWNSIIPTQKRGNQSMDDVAWPRGFRFGGRSSRDIGNQPGRVKEIRWWNPPQDCTRKNRDRHHCNKTYGIYRGSNGGDWKSAMNSSIANASNGGQRDFDYGPWQKFLRNFENRQYIVQRNVTRGGKHKSAAIWGTRTSKDGPDTDIYLAYEPNDTEYWGKKLPKNQLEKVRNSRPSSRLKKATISPNLSFWRHLHNLHGKRVKTFCKGDIIISDGGNTQTRPQPP